MAGKRASGLALTCIVQDVSRCARTQHLPEGLLESLLPGPVTLVLERSAGALCEELNPGLSRIGEARARELFCAHSLLLSEPGVRIPASSFVRSVAREFGAPLALTSANRSGCESSVAAHEFSELWSQARAARGAEAHPLSDSLPATAVRWGVRWRGAGGGQARLDGGGPVRARRLCRAQGGERQRERLGSCVPPRPEKCRCTNEGWLMTHSDGSQTKKLCMDSSTLQSGRRSSLLLVILIVVLSGSRPALLEASVSAPRPQRI